MIAILASRFDSEVKSIIDLWSSSEAELISAEDLCRAGWKFRLSNPNNGTAIVNGKRVLVSEINAILTRRPAVLSEELTFINHEDRSYVASEINAFLVAWLNALACPVINRATTSSLCGPQWNELHWKSAAAHYGLRWAEGRQTNDIEEVIVCCKECFFSSSNKQKIAALKMAEAANVELLSVRFYGDLICGTSVRPPLVNVDILSCLLEYIKGHS